MEEAARLLFTNLRHFVVVQQIHLKFRRGRQKQDTLPKQISSMDTILQILQRRSVQTIVLPATGVATLGAALRYYTSADLENSHLAAASICDLRWPNTPETGHPETESRFPLEGQGTAISDGTGMANTSTTVSQAIYIAPRDAFEVLNR